jgi:hypothetical protein
MTYAFLVASPSPAPEPTEMEPWEVSPGLLGFLLGFFVLAVAVVPLFRSMAKHMRRVDHNERLRQAAEEASDGGTPPARGGARDEGNRPDDAGATRVGQSPTD